MLKLNALKAQTDLKRISKSRCCACVILPVGEKPKNSGRTPALDGKKKEENQ